jgi:hypothetical protein
MTMFEEHSDGTVRVKNNDGTYLDFVPNIPDEIKTMLRREITQAIVEQIVDDILADGQQRAIRADWGHVLACEYKSLRSQLADKDAEIARIAKRENDLLLHLQNGRKLPNGGEFDEYNFERYVNPVNAAYVDGLIFEFNEKYKP